MGQNVMAALAVVLLSGCGASGPQFQEGLAKPDSGRALLYVYRTNTMIGIINGDVPFMHLDGRRLARIRIGGYAAIPISPGKHRLTTTESLLGEDIGKVRGETTFTVSAGSVVYLRYTEVFESIVPIVVPGAVIVATTGDFRFEAIPEAEARVELASTNALELIGKAQ